MELPGARYAAVDVVAVLVAAECKPGGEHREQPVRAERLGYAVDDEHEADRDEPGFSRNRPR